MVLGVPNRRRNAAVSASRFAANSRRERSFERIQSVGKPLNLFAVHRQEKLLIGFDLHIWADDEQTV